jgi:SAM-dependent methyltransferase
MPSVAAAGDADPTGTYLVGDAAALPFDDDSFDLVVAYNTLMDVDDLPGSVREAGWVLAPGGRLVLVVVYPATNVGSDPQALTDRDYFARRHFREEVHQDGMTMVFQGWEHPLQAYTIALEENGFPMESLREPACVQRDGSALLDPLHLWIRAVRS